MWELISIVCMSNTSLFYHKKGGLLLSIIILAPKECSFKNQLFMALLGSNFWRVFSDA